MSIYTYHIHTSLSAALGIQSQETTELSDQVLRKRPSGSKNLGPAFPILCGENHPHYGKCRPDSVKKKISESRTGQSLAPWTDERRIKTKTSLTGRKLSFEHVEKMKKMRIGSKCSEETKEKMKESQRVRRLKEKLDNM